MTTSYRITVRSTGMDMGVFSAPDEDAAHEALARDAGYVSVAAMAVSLGTTLEALRSDCDIIMTDRRVDRRILSLSEALHRGKYLVDVAEGEGAIKEDDGMDILKDIAIAALEEAIHEGERPADGPVERQVTVAEFIQRIRALIEKAERDTE